MEMDLESEKIRHELEDALKTLAESKGDGLARRIKPILFANLDRGRIQHFTDGETDLVPTYVWLVADGFTARNEYIHQLQAERSAEAWGPLFERMQSWAYNFFLRKNFAANHGTQEIADECATEAALALLNAYFPYDTDFDPWAHIIVQNACRKFIHKSLKKSVIPNEKIVDLKENLVDPDELLLEVGTLQKELRIEMTNLLAQLSEARRSVIEFIYFHEMEPEEVARKMGKNVGAIYSLQFHALRDLRKILSTIRDNLND
jgi:RNA polymerase sigma factor (sigma-70 family)